MKEYLVWYVIQPITSQQKDLNDMMWKLGMWWILGEKENPIFKSNKIKVDKIILPKIYEYLSKKNNVSIWTITILWISPLEYPPFTH